MTGWQKLDLEIAKGNFLSISHLNAVLQQPGLAEVPAILLQLLLSQHSGQSRHV